MSKKPNILAFVADQMRNDALHLMGNAASLTPNLDAMATEGVAFQNAYCQNPVCVPSRSSFLTGLYPHTTGHQNMHYLQREDEPNLLKVMKENGYEVIWIGRNDVVPADRAKTAYCDEYYDGRDFFNKRDWVYPLTPPLPNALQPAQEKPIDEDFYSFYVGKLENADGYGKEDWNCIQSALDYIERKSQNPDGKPFFLYCTINFPHPPYACEEPWYSSIDRKKLPPRRPNIQTLKNKASMLSGIAAKQNMQTWTEARFDALRATYLAMVSRVDTQFKSVCDKLKEMQMYDDTSIFFFSDHGDYTGDYGIAEKVQNSFEDPICNVPLIVKPAKQFDVKPRVTPAFAELLDFPATVAEMAGVKLGYRQFGKSLLEVLAGADVHKDAVFCQGGRLSGEEHTKELGHTPASQYWPRLSTQYSDGPEHTKACMIRMGNFKYTMRLYEMDEFYDLSADPMELDNKINDASYAQEIQALATRLLYFYMETSDFVPNKRDKRF